MSYLQQIEQVCSCGHIVALHTIGCDACNCPRGAQDVLSNPKAKSPEIPPARHPLELLAAVLRIKGDPK